MAQTQTIGVLQHRDSRYRASPLQVVLRFCSRKPLGAAGAIVTIVLIMGALFAPAIEQYSPTAQNHLEAFQAPSGSHWLGTDNFGRDVYSRIVHGSRVSLAVGLASSLLGVTLGALLGLFSGYVLGKTDLFIQRVVDILETFPLLILALVMVAALGPSLPNVILAISVPILPRAARVLRSSALSIREMTYIEGAKAIGASSPRIIFRYMVPNSMAPYIILVTAQLGGAILTEASLSFLGLGIPEPYPSWGRMLSGAAVEYAQRAPWLVITPGLAISVVVFGFNLLGDALRDALDPRLRSG